MDQEMWKLLKEAAQGCRMSTGDGIFKWEHHGSTWNGPCGEGFPASSLALAFLPSSDPEVMGKPPARASHNGWSLLSGLRGALPLPKDFHQPLTAH